MGASKSSETRKKMSEAKRGKRRAPFSPEHRFSLSLANTRVMANTDHRNRISESVKAAKTRKNRANCNIAIEQPVIEQPVDVAPVQSRHIPRLIPVEEMTPAELRKWCETGEYPYR